MNLVILILALVELIAVRIIGYPLNISEPATKTLFLLGSIAAWGGIAFVIGSFFLILLRKKKEQLNISLSITVPLWLFVIGSILLALFPEVIWIQIIFYLFAMFVILSFFNVPRRQVDQVHHMLCYMFSTPLLFRFAYYLLDLVQKVTIVQFPDPIFFYLRCVDEIAVLAALFGAGMVLYDVLVHRWSPEKLLFVILPGVLFLSLSILLLVYPWATLASLREMGFKLLAHNALLAIILYGIPIFTGLVVILSLLSIAKYRIVGYGMLFVFLSSHAPSHTTLFYNVLAIFGVLIILFMGFKRPKYKLGSAKSLI